MSHVAACCVTVPRRTAESLVKHLSVPPGAKRQEDSIRCPLAQRQIQEMFWPDFLAPVDFQEAGKTPGFIAYEPDSQNRQGFKSSGLGLALRVMTLDPYLMVCLCNRLTFVSTSLLIPSGTPCILPVPSESYSAAEEKVARNC